MRLNLRIFVVCMAIVSMTLVTTAQTRPDLNGIWKLNPTQSKFGDPEATPKEVTLKLDLQGQTLRETLTVVNASGKSTVSLNYALDGRVSTNNVGGEEIRSTANWQGDQLVLAWSDHGGTFTRRFIFADQGRKITVNAHDSNSESETDDLLVFEKQ